MAGRPRDLALERQWRERVARWRLSGLSVRAFCRRHGWVETSFHSWNRKLRAREAAVAASPAATSPTTPASRPQRPPTFVPVTVIPAATVSVEVRCPSGHVVLLSSCDAASLTQLFAALAPERPC